MYTPTGYRLQAIVLQLLFDNAGDLPFVYGYVMGLVMIGALAATGTWVTFGPGSRSFHVSAPFFEIRGGGETIGRIAFGIGAVITWRFFAVFAIGGARKLFGQNSY